MVSNSITFRQGAYEKLEKPLLADAPDGSRKPLVCHSFLTSEMLGLLCREIAANVEHQMLFYLSLSRNL